LQQTQIRRFVFLLLLVAFAAYSAVFIWQSSFVIDGERYFVLFDDAMISMQYARNLQQGYGLVWNPGGPHVEGFSSPLWVGILALVHFLPLPASKISVVVQILGALFLLLNLVYVKKVADLELEDSRWFAFIAVLLTAFYYPLIQWSLLGNEVGLLALAVTFFTWLALSRKYVVEHPWRFYGLLSLLLFIRLDAAIAFVAIWGYSVWQTNDDRKAQLLAGGVWLAAAILIQTIFRLAYFGELLPNTYYLKMTGFPILKRVVREIFELARLIWRMNWILFLIPFVGYLLRPRRGPALLVSMVILQILYNLYIGGDAWEHRGGANRFIAIVMPLFFVLFALGVKQLHDLSLERLKQVYEARWLHTGAVMGVVVFSSFSLLNFNTLVYPSDLKYLFLLQSSVFTIGNQRNTEIGLFVKGITDPDATVAFVAAGAGPYFAEREAIDILGKSDPYIAHQPSPLADTAGWTDYRPGHNKWDYEYVLDDLRPDVFVEVFRGGSEEAEPYLDAYYVRIEVPQLASWLPDGTLYLRRDSSLIRWSQVESYRVIEP
jgi:hypothetical protein